MPETCKVADSPKRAVLCTLVVSSRRSTACLRRADVAAASRDVFLIAVTAFRTGFVVPATDATRRAIAVAASQSASGAGASLPCSAHEPSVATHSTAGSLIDPSRSNETTRIVQR